MSLRGIEFHTEEVPQAIVKSADGSLSLKTNKGTVEGFSHVMFATGRRPNTKVKYYNIDESSLMLVSRLQISSCCIEYVFKVCLNICISYNHLMISE